LYAECYLYRLIRTVVANTTHWKSHDPFLEQKIKTFQSSASAIHRLAQTIIDLDEQKDQLQKDGNALRTLLGEIVHMCLWGNATDLSLLTDITHADIQQLQTVSKWEQTDRAKYIRKDDGPLAWDLLNKARQDRTRISRVDFILDNAGFEASSMHYWSC